MKGLAVRLPLNKDEIDGAYSLIKDFRELVKQNFKMLLFTMPGERIMDPNYGVGLKQYLFENIVESQTMQSGAKARIFSQVEQYMPYIEIDNIDFVGPNNDPNSIYFYIKYTIVPLSLEEELSLPFEIENLA